MTVAFLSLFLLAMYALWKLSNDGPAFLIKNEFIMVTEVESVRMLWSVSLVSGFFFGLTGATYLLFCKPFFYGGCFVFPPYVSVF